MRLEKQRVRTEKWYSVGYSPLLDEYVMCVAVGWYTVYNRYYHITEEEYSLSFNAPDRLDELADSLFKAANGTERFICSEKAAENTASQNMLCEQLIKDKNEAYEKYTEMMKDFERF